MKGMEMRVVKILLNELGPLTFPFHRTTFPSSLVMIPTQTQFEIIGVPSAFTA